MKKTLFIIAACALAAVSCQKESAVENEIKTEGIITVTADIAQFGGDTKTSINGSATEPKPLWSSSDQIKLFDTDGNSAIYVLKSGEEGKSSATFEIKSGETALTGTFACAYYPAANATAYTHGTGITATIPATQTYTTANSGDTGTNAGTFAPGAAPMVGTGTFDASTGNLGLTFKNVFGILQLNFTGSETIKQIDVIGTTNLSGTATITTGDAPTCTISSGQKYVTLTTTESTRPTLSETSTAFYIAVPTGEKLISKVGVTTTTAGYNKSMTTGNEKTITRSSILSMTSIAVSNSSMTSGAIYLEAPDMTPVTLALTISGSSKNVTWAPVNCGYDSTSAPTGLFYQWGRKYGQANTGTVSYITTQANSMAAGNTEENKDKFYKGSACWFSGTTTSDTWSSEYDPCPAGWRVPTEAELQAVYSTKEWTSTGGPSSNQTGYLFGTSPNQVFFPVAGFRDCSDGSVYDASTNGYYWSSSPDTGLADFAGRLGFRSGDARMSCDARANGCSVRCVQE